MAKFAFFQAHPDDLELNCGYLMHYLSKKSNKKHEIKIISLTKGEFGLPGAKYDKFKGDFLAKIRTQELINAQLHHNIKEKDIEFFGLIDGYVEFNHELINKTRGYLELEKPDVIIAPEPIYTYYFHQDHINCGKAIYYIIKNNLIDYTPNLFYYSSLCPNFYFGFNKDNLLDQLIGAHKTQFWLLNYMKMAYGPLSRYYGIKLKGWRNAEPYRRIFFKNKHKNKPSLVAHILSHFCAAHKPWYNAKYPES